ncbi:MAG: ADP-ribosyltransferase [Bacteroidales bacterium]|nr:ADP-ribosyltransferase [Bacteroidales bacterium]
MAEMDKWEKRHRADTYRYMRQIEKIYDQAAVEAAKLGIGIDGLGENLFSFDDFPQLKQRLEHLLNDMRQHVESTVVNGIDAGWQLANERNDELVHSVFGKAAKGMSVEQQLRYFSNNEAAHEAFLQRKVGGLGLSDRVWKYTQGFKNEIEMGLDVGIRDGKSAAEIARDIKQYLVYPDKLFRRVRDEHGNLHLSKAAKAFHPGQGVYRSSYMNARRLAATETNMAYRTADHERHQQLDFIVGIEINLSNNHTSRGVKGVFYDICDDLKGKYPKDFKFTGWHPHCRCYVTTILKTEKELEADRERIMQGKEPTQGSENYVGDVPQGFKDWLDDNAERIQRAKALPYFLRDNGSMVDGAFHLMEFNPPVKTIAELAMERHLARTPEQVASILQKWGQHEDKMSANALLMRRAENMLQVAAKQGIDNTGLEKALSGMSFSMQTSKYGVQTFTRYNKATLGALEAAMQDVKAKVLEAQREARKAALEAQREAAHVKARATKLIDIAGKAKDLDATALKAALATGDTETIKKGIADFMLQVQQVRQELKDLSTVIPDAKKWHEQFTLAELQAVKDSIHATKAKLAAKHYVSKFEDLPLAKQKKLLEFEEGWVSNPNFDGKPHKLHHTWQVAQAAYKKEIAAIDYKIALEPVEQKLADLKAYLSTSKSDKIANLVKVAESMKAAGSSVSAISIKVDEAIAIMAKNEASKISHAKAAAAKKLAKLQAEKAKLEQDIADLKAKGTLTKTEQKKLTKLQDELAKVDGEITSMNGPFGPDAYTDARKNAAFYEKNGNNVRVDNEFRAETERVWATMSDDEKRALTAYTEGSGHMNRPLRGYDGSWNNYKGVGKVPLNNEGGEKHIIDATSAISRSHAKEDLWLVRGWDSRAGAEAFLGESYTKIMGMTQAELNANFLGKEIVDEAFMSCGTMRGTGFGGPLLGNIYCPKGTQLIYTEPFSHFNGDSLNSYNNLWDGSSKYTLRHEFETIIQRGTKYRISKIYINKGQLYIDLEVVGQI